jgi:ribosomal small subunit protein bTHX
MGKGDKKSKKGKIAIGSYGRRRKRKKKSAIPIQSATVKAPVEKVATKKEAAPKETTKKESTAKKTSKAKKEE